MWHHQYTGLPRARRSESPVNHCISVPMYLRITRQYTGLPWGPTARSACDPPRGDPSICRRSRTCSLRAFRPARAHPTRGCLSASTRRDGSWMTVRPRTECVRSRLDVEACECTQSEGDRDHRLAHGLVAPRWVGRARRRLLLTRCIAVEGDRRTRHRGRPADVLRESAKDLGRVRDG